MATNTMNTGKNRRLGRGLVKVLLMASAVAGAIGACSSSPAPTAIPATRTPKPTFTRVALVTTATPTVTATAPPSPTPSPSPAPTPTLDPNFNPLTGKMVADPKLLQRRPLLVRIGNDPEVRPQSGLSQADVVYEEAMDGWTITRFTAIILAEDPEELRPIRSARLFTIELGHMYEGALVHSGANDQVRWLLSQSGLTDLDEYFHSEPYHWLDPQGKWESYPWMGRVATAASNVRDYLTAKGMEMDVRLPGFTFSAEGATPPSGEPAKYLHIPYPRRALVEFRYDPLTRTYQRFVQEEPHVDALNGEQLSASNVIVHYAEYQETDVLDVNGAPTLNIISTGEGRAQVFRDGVLIEAKWIRPELGDFCRYVYLDGSPVPLRPGQSWIEVVPLEYQVTHENE